VLEELANNSMQEEVEDVNDKFDLPEDVSEIVNGCKEAINQGFIENTHGSNVNNVDLLQSLVELRSPLVGGQVQKSDNNVMPDGDYDLRSCGFAVDVFCSHDISIAAKDTDNKTIVSMEKDPYKLLVFPFYYYLIKLIFCYNIYLLMKQTAHYDYDCDPITNKLYIELLVQTYSSTFQYQAPLRF
jgi:hypothetical protein